MISPATRADGEQGYALIAAVACIAIFATMAFAIISATRVGMATGGGEVSAARARLAAEAGVETVLHSLALGDSTTLARLGGGETTLDVDGARVVVRLADERGKVPLNNLDDAALDRLLRGAGLDDAQLATARDSYLDWLDDDDLGRPDGAEAPFYALRGIALRNSPIVTIDELALIRGFTPQLVARLRPYVTAEGNTVPFERRFAVPQALAVMDEAGADSPAAIIRAREVAGQRTALDFIDKKTLKGRPVTIHAEAATPDGGRAHRELVVVMTGRADFPWVIIRAD